MNKFDRFVLYAAEVYALLWLAAKVGTIVFMVAHILL